MECMKRPTGDYSLASDNVGIMICLCHEAKKEKEKSKKRKRKKQKKKKKKVWESLAARSSKK